ncbi:MAG: hypothetical protein JWM76_3712, partial [Pseudonocardiales bacterium]|nr:hypothetical protein [Pseudonocardiales bacterium]
AGFPNLDDGSASRTIQYGASTIKQVYGAGFFAAAVVTGGGAATPQTDVTFSVYGANNSAAASANDTPIYVFAAPVNWNVTAGSASFAAGTVPAGVAFAYRTVVLAGVSRQVVVATWPSGTYFGKNATWPTMKVVARPGPLAAPGTSVATAYAGDSNNKFTTAQATYGSAVTDTTDMDADGNTTQGFSSSNQNVTVGAASGMSVRKEICKPDGSGGCIWISDSTQSVGFGPLTTNIKYRLTVSNTGNTTLTGLVGYDVLPYIGDVGISAATQTTPRNSTFRETLSGLGAVTAGETVTYSQSTNPCRSEVNANPTSACTDDWATAAPTNTQSIKISVAGNVVPGAIYTTEYTAAVSGAAPNGTKACNSVAVSVSNIGTPSEPAPVCAIIQSTDLAISSAAMPPMQEGRPAQLTYSVINNGAATPSAASVALSIPTGITVASLAPAGWTCASSQPGTTAPIIGPDTVTCTANTPLVANTAQTLVLSVIPTTLAPASLSATITGPYYNTTPANNTVATTTTTPGAPVAPMVVTKTDGVSSVVVGDTVTYTITFTNPRTTESVSNVKVVDTLPPGMVFVSATNGGTSTSVVTWAIASLAAGASASVQVTAKVAAPSAGAAPATSFENDVTVTIPDPASSTASFTGNASDVDTSPSPSLTVVKSSDVSIADLGETINYSFLVTNTGNIALSAIQVADVFTAPAGPALTVTCPQASVAPNGTLTCTASGYTVSQADADYGTILNTATASGQQPTSESNTTPARVQTIASSQNTVAITPAPALTVVKTASSTPVTKLGDPVTYSFAVKNTGNVTLTSVGVTDAQAAPASPLSAAPTCLVTTLAPGVSTTCSATYNATQADVDNGQIVDSATAHGTAPTSQGGVIPAPTLSIQSKLTVPITAAPALTVTKTASAG